MDAVKTKAIEKCISKNQDGSYSVRVTKRIGQQQIERKKSGIKTLGEARRLRSEYQGELAHLAKIGLTKEHTWEIALREYLKISESRHTFSTWKSTKSVLETHTTIWNQRKIDDLHGNEISSRIDESLAESPNDTKLKLLQYIRAVFQYQVSLGHLKANPCNGIYYKKSPQKALKAMTRNEIITLLDNARKKNHEWYPIWRVIYELGLRSGEGIALTWQDVDFENDRVTISKSYCFKSKKIGSTKNEKVRLVPINENLKSFLKEMKLKAGSSTNVFTIPTKWIRGEAAKVLRAFQQDIGIRETNFHSLRASFITHLLNKRVPFTKIMEMVGHSEFKTTKRYIRLSGSDLDGETDAISIDLDNPETQGRLIELKKKD